MIPLTSDEAGEGAVVGKRRTTLAARLKGVYGTGNVDKVDAFVGMLSEPHVRGTEFGELQLAMWKKQFEALRDGDRFFYRNDPMLDRIRSQYQIDYPPDARERHPAEHRGEGRAGRLQGADRLISRPAGRQLALRQVRKAHAVSAGELLRTVATAEFHYGKLRGSET